jgi:hypothetical protein
MSDIAITVVSGETIDIGLAIPGVQGPAGVNTFPSGGTEGQVVVKQSATDYDALWTSSLSGITINDASVTSSSIISPIISGVASTGSGLTVGASGDTLSFFGSSPVVCPSGVAIPSGGSTADEVGAALSGVIVALEALGLVRL